MNTHSDRVQNEQCHNSITPSKTAAYESEMRQWGRKDFLQKYLDIADIFIIGRRDSLEILKSFYRHCVKKGNPTRILDLGCGDGVLTRQLLSIDQNIVATLVDGSKDMLEKARQRLATTNCEFIQAIFQELIAGKVELPQFELAVSSLAIHHLTTRERKTLFCLILDHLVDGGHFINIDTVRSPTAAIEQWHLDLWREDVEGQKPSHEVTDKFETMMAGYLEGEHYSKIDTLQNQMDGMRQAGFTDLECFYKRGMFAMYGGRK